MSDTAQARAEGMQRANPDLLIVARPQCERCDDGTITVGDGYYEGAGCHEELCPDCGGTGHPPMVALPAKVVEEWAAVVRWTLARRKLIDVSPEAVRLAQEARP